MTSSQGNPLTGHAALGAVASPARLELISALGDGQVTVKQLARRLGRSRQSLYYHLSILEDAGLVAVESSDEAGGERFYRLRTQRLEVGVRNDSEADRNAAVKAIRAILRLTAREASEALTDPWIRLDGALREMIAFRGKVRLDEAGLYRVNELIDELVELLRTSEGASTAIPIYALTLVLTPAREAGDSSQSPRKES